MRTWTQAGTRNDRLFCSLTRIAITAGRTHDWHVLVAGLVTWHDSADPWTQLGRTVSLRLLRGMPSGAHYAYRTLMGVPDRTSSWPMPDRDYSKRSVTRTEQPQRCCRSLFHMRRAVTHGLIASTPRGMRAQQTHRHSCAAARSGLAICGCCAGGH